MMTGPTLTSTVSSAVESTRAFPSHSVHPLSQGQSPPPAQTRPSSSPAPSWSDKSLPELPVYAVPAIDFGVDVDFDLNLPFNATALTSAADSPPDHINAKSARVSIRHSSGGSRPLAENMGRRKSIVLSRPQSWMPSSKSTPDLGRLPQPSVEEPVVGRAGDGPHSSNLSVQDGPRTVSDSFALFARRSWISTSRSPSPNTRPAVGQTPEVRFGRERAPSNSSVMKLRKGSRNRSDSSSSESTRSIESSSKLGNYLNKIKARSHTARTKGSLPNELGSSASSSTSLAPPSTETRKSHASETSNSTYPDDVTAARNSSVVRDPLWSPFKVLETDFQRFQSKPTAVKMNMVRNSLVPFLQKYASHSFHLDLHHEDLERRAVILNKWWTGLLDMLHVKTHPPVPGVDRPILLDAVSNIMMRPEWRQGTPTFRPLVERNPQERVRRKSQSGFDESSESTSSFQSTDSAYLAESARHNVRNMFTANLVSQMALIVEKLSLRHAPISLVNFAGKACAYAFFFAPGVADVLVRLWCLTPNLLRRIADELNLPRRSKGESDDIVVLFPPSLEKLGWTSVSSMSEALRKPAQPPLAATKIAWTGPWVARWNGRDSDLFFIFCKYYFTLAEGFTPPGLPLVEKARAPGFVLVNAQVLSILNSTIHRQAVVETPLADALNGADASLMAVQMAAPSNNNLFRGMSENRLVVLLKNFLSEASASSGSARCTFAESFLAIMKAAVKHTSQFDHTACFTICDFLEESLVIYSLFVASSCTQVIPIDWPFWLEVCNKILESNNSMSEIRVLSLVFSIWDTIASDQHLKERVCLDWLLTDKTFDKLFNNWCPMVRAYYMRLLCWRICRDAGNANESDAKIFLLVFTRLKKVWSHYLWLKQDHEQKGKIPPSTAPSFPTPGKRFMIVRTEIPSLQPAFVTGFDSLPLSPRHDMTGAPATDFDSMSNPNPEPLITTKKTWSILGKIFSPTTNAGSNDDLETLRRETAASRTSVAPPQISTDVTSPTNSDTDSIGSSPTFEATQYLFKFILSWNNAGTMPPPNRILTRPRLPNPAQSWVTIKGHGCSPPPMAGPPAPTRAVSGSPFPGLVNSARNAGVSEVPSSPSSASTAVDRRDSIGRLSFTDLHEDDIPLRSAAGLSKENLVNPVEPSGSFARSVKYAGRALAEWGLVVAECNSFIERRREEGVLGLQDVEVPALGVEGFRKICG